MDRKRRQSRAARASVPEAESAGPTRMAQDGAPCEELLDEFVAWVDAEVRLLLLVRGRLLLQIRVDEFPAVDFQALDVLLDLRGLKAQTVRDDEARATAHAVRLDPCQVAISRDLLILRPFAVDRHRAVRNDEFDLLVRGR